MLLKLTTIAAAAAFLVWVPVAQAWSWPVQGPVLQPFSYDEAHPYAAGQHRGIDIGTSASGDPVYAPAGGTVSFAGSVPTNGTCVTIETPDGYSVTLTHLGSLAVAKGAAVTEGAVIGTVGPSGTPDEPGPYVHLGIRLSADANGYIDPLGLLPPAANPTPQDSTAPAPAADEAGPQTSSDPVTATAPAPTAAGAGLVVRSRPSAPSTSVAPAPGQASSRVQTTRRTTRAVRRPATQDVRRPTAKPLSQASEPRTWNFRRPVAEPSAEIAAAPSAPVLVPFSLAAGPGIVAALAALATALVRRRRRRPPAAVVRFPQELETRRAA